MHQSIELVYSFRIRLCVEAAPSPQTGALRDLGPPCWSKRKWAKSPCLASFRQVTKAEGTSLAAKYGCSFREVSACLEFESVQQMFHEAVREVRRETQRHMAVRPLFIIEEKPSLHLVPAATVTSKHGLATLSTVNFKEIPSVAQAKLVTVKSSRAQSKRKAPTLTLLKGFKIF